MASDSDSDPDPEECSSWKGSWLFTEDFPMKALPRPIKMVKSVVVKLSSFGPQWEQDYTYLEASRFLKGEVTLGCGSMKNQTDIKIFKGHKIVLEQRSGFFKRSIDFLLDAHLVFVFKNIQARTMKHILDFLYTGKVTLIRDQELDKFMAATTQLEITGITPEIEYSCDMPESSLTETDDADGDDEDDDSDEEDLEWPKDSVKEENEQEEGGGEEGQQGSSEGAGGQSAVVIPAESILDSDYYERESDGEAAGDSGEEGGTESSDEDEEEGAEGE